MTNFAELFSAALDAHAMSPGEAARLLRARGLTIDRGTLNRWRNGETTPRVDKLDVVRALPDALGMMPGEKAAFLRDAGRALGLSLVAERPRPAPLSPVAQRVHYGADVLLPFAGREKELARLRQLVVGHTSVLITGMAGVGKTRLAQEVLRSAVSEFTHGCEFLTITAGMSSDRILRSVARLLNVEVSPGDSSPRQQRLILRRMSEQLRGVDLLFLLDNVESVDQVSELVRSLPSITWIITARRGSLKRIGVHPVHLELPTPADAAAIFQAHLGYDHVAHDHVTYDRFDTRLTAETVALAGRLPIAIRLLSGLVSGGTVTTAEEMRDWMERTGLLRSGLHSRRLRRFFDQLMQTVPPESRAVLEVCGIFATRSIQTVNLDGVCRRAGIRATPGALEGLADFSLIDYPDESRVELHPLVHEYARNRLRAGPRHDKVWDAFKSHYLSVARAVSDAAHDTDRDYRKLARMESNLLRTAAAFHESADWPRLKEIWPALSGYLWNTGNYTGYEAFDRQCLDGARATGDTDWEAVLLSELGFVSMETGAWDKADALYRQSQALHDAADGQALAQARLRRYRAALAMRQGQLDAAAELLAECGRLLAPLTNPPVEKLDLARLLYHSAVMSVHFRRGEPAAAEAAGLAAERYFDRLNPGGAGHRVAEYRLELGDVQYKLGKVDDARCTWEGVLAPPGTELLMLPPEHAEARLRLAWLRAVEGGAQQALRPAEEARRIFLRHGRMERHAAADDLLARVESGAALPSFDELLDPHAYPGY